MPPVNFILFAMGLVIVLMGVMLALIAIYTKHLAARIDGLEADVQEIKEPLSRTMRPRIYPTGRPL